MPVILSLFLPLLIDYVPDHCSVLTTEYRVKLLCDDDFDEKNLTQ